MTRSLGSRAYAGIGVSALLWLAVVARATRAEPSSLAATTGPRLESGQPGSAVVRYLEERPLALRKTPEYQRLLVKAYRMADEPWRAGETLEFLEMLSPGSARARAVHEKWRGRSASAFIAETLRFREEGDAVAAAEAYAKAVECDPGVFPRIDPGLGEDSLSTLTRALRSGNATVMTWYDLGYLNYRLSRPGPAKAAFEEVLAREDDPYWHWKAACWIDRIDREVALASRSRQETRGTIGSGPDGAVGPEEPIEAGGSPDRTSARAAIAADRALERHRQLMALDARIRDLDGRIDEARRSLEGRVAIGQTGEVLVVAVNHRRVKAQIELLARRRQELSDERAAMEQVDRP